VNPENPSTPRILLIGHTGQVGGELEPLLRGLGNVTACDHMECDLSQPKQVRSMVESANPHIIVNAAAYTAVDLAEKEAEMAQAVNAAGPALLAEEAGKRGAAIVHYSTEYVFDGSKTAAYNESDSVSPLSIYGKTKAEGDRAIQDSGTPHLIFRTTWVYGNKGKNFLNTIRRLAREKEELRIVDDQAGAPTWCRSIAKATANILSQVLNESNPADLSQLEKSSGLYNMTCGGKTTWFGFAKAVVDALELAQPPRVTPITTAEFPTPATRPKNSILDNSKLRDHFGVTLPDWDRALNFCLKED